VSFKKDPIGPHRKGVRTNHDPRAREKTEMIKKYSYRDSDGLALLKNLSEGSDFIEIENSLELQYQEWARLGLGKTPGHPFDLFKENKQLKTTIARAILALENNSKEDVQKALRAELAKYE